MASFLPPGNNFINGLGSHRHGRRPSDNHRPNLSSDIMPLYRHLATAGLSCQWIKSLQRHGLQTRATLGAGQIPSPPNIPKPNKGSWGIVWTILSILLPFWKPYFKQLLLVESEVEEVVECAAKIVEEVAVVVDKVAEEIAETLPEGSKLKEAAIVIECVSKEAEKDAELTINIINKVDEFKEGMEERIVEVELKQKHKTNEADNA